jgi:hypothetical protein
MLKASEIRFRIEETEKRANKVDLHWALCIIESPLTKDAINYRVGYFENLNELEYWVDRMHQTYNTQLDFPYMIESSYAPANFIRGNFKVNYDA